MNFNGINIEKSFYNSQNRNLTEILEEMDPSSEYIGTEYENLDAFERQLKRFDIRVKGKTSDKIEKFFSTDQTSALFPEYVARAVRQGIDLSSAVKDIVATTTRTDSLDYRTIRTNMDGDDLELQDTDEGGEIPSTEIKTSSNLVKIKKRGRMISASYEALKFQKLDLFTVALRQIGNYIAVSQMTDAVDVIVNGDGNENPAEVINVQGELGYKDLLKLYTALTPYKLDVILAGTDALEKLLAMEEFRDANAGLDFHGTGKMSTPLGAKLIHVPSMEKGMIIGLDSSCALEMVEAGDVLTEHDRLIDHQLERAVVTCMAGFAKLYDGASKVLKFTAE